VTAALAIVLAAWGASPALADGPAFGAGERIVMRIGYARILAGRATLLVETVAGRPTLRFVATAKSQGFFAWLFRFEVDDRTAAEWDPASGCSLGIEKRLREGRARRDQKVVIDPVRGRAEVEDAKVSGREFQIAPCTLDVLSALFVARARGVREGEPPLRLPVFDNGKDYVLETRFLRREPLDLPAPLGGQTPTVVVEPVLAEGTGLFVKEGRLELWLTDDARRIPVRMRSKVAVGSVVAELESYTPPVTRAN
jgi:hypothetical protein